MPSLMCIGGMVHAKASQDGTETLFCVLQPTVIEDLLVGGTAGAAAAAATTPLDVVKTVQASHNAIYMAVTSHSILGLHIFAMARTAVMCAHHVVLLGVLQRALKMSEGPGVC